MQSVLWVAGTIGLLVAAGVAAAGHTRCRLSRHVQPAIRGRTPSISEVGEEQPAGSPRARFERSSLPFRRVQSPARARVRPVHRHNRFESRSKLAPDPNAKVSFYAELEKSDALVVQILSRDSSNADAMFAQVLGQGLRRDYAAMIEKRDLAGLGYMKSGRTLAQQLLAEHPDHYDAYLGGRAENYLLSQQVAPLRWALRLTGAQTDKQTGLSNFRLTAERGHYLLPFASLLLTAAALRDNEKNRGRELLAKLSHEFPQNHFYAKELTKLQQQTTALQH
jgi:hypothetical protein